MNAAALRVLVVAATLPYPPRWGYATRVYQLVRQASRRHDVTLLTYASPADRESVAQFRSEVAVEVVERAAPTLRSRRLEQLVSLRSSVPFPSQATYSPEMQHAINELCAAQRYDVIHIESTLLWEFSFPPVAPIVLDEHNIDYEVFGRMRAAETSRSRRWFYGVEERRVRAYERRAWREVDACVLTSAREEAIVREHAPGTLTAVVPNGVDVEAFRARGGSVEPHSLLFNGVLDYRPNLDAMEFFVEHILPRVRRAWPDAVLTMVGRGSDDQLERFRRPGVRVTGEVPDVRPHLERAAVVVVPIRTGSGTRFKVVEGLALEKPMVSTALGCEGIAVRHGRHLLVADTAEAFAAAIGRLFEDPAYGARLGAAGRRLVEDEYSWEAAGERLEEVYRSVVHASAGALIGASATRAGCLP